MIHLLPSPIIILACIFLAMGIGMRIGIAFANKLDEKTRLEHDVLNEEYSTLYEDVCYQESLLKMGIEGVEGCDSDKLAEFVSKAKGHING